MNRVEILEQVLNHISGQADQLATFATNAAERADDSARVDLNAVKSTAESMGALVELALGDPSAAAAHFGCSKLAEELPSGLFPAVGLETPRAPEVRSGSPTRARLGSRS